MSISPDGSLVAFRLATPSVQRNTTSLDWYVIRIDKLDSGPQWIASGGEPNWIPGYGLFEAERPVWSADSKSFYFRAINDGEVALWTAHLDGVAHKITTDAADVGRYIFDGTSHTIIYQTGPTRSAILLEENREYDEGIELGETVDLEDSLYRNMRYHGRMTTIRRGLSDSLTTSKFGYGTTLLASSPTTLKEIDPSTGQLRQSHLTAAEFEVIVSNNGSEMNGGVPLVDEGTRGTAFAFQPSSCGSVNQWSGCYTLAWKPGNGGKTVSCQAPMCADQRIRGLKWRPQTDEILFIVEGADGSTGLDAWNVRRNAVRRIDTSDGLLGSGASADRYESQMCPANRDVAICTVATATSPPALVAIDLNDGRHRIIFDPNAALSGRPMGRIEHLEWDDRWGRHVTGVLTLPNSKTSLEKYPLVITGYNCKGFLRGGSGSDVPEYVLASLNIAALCVNFDLPTMYNKPYPSGKIPTGEQGNAQSNLDAWDAGVALLLRRGIVDPRRLGVSGLSFGAISVHYALTHTGLFAAAAATEPDISDPLDYYLLSAEGPPGRDVLRQYNMPEPDQGRQFYADYSSALRVDRIDVPLLIQTSEREFRFGIQYYGALKINKKTFEFYVFPEESHQFMQPKHRRAWNDRFIDWFDFWLNGHEDPEPAKAEQYRRWEKLCDLQREHSPDRPTFCVPSHSAH